MSIVIERDGWKISGDSVSDLTMGIAAVQQALQSAPLREVRPRGRPKSASNNGGADNAKKERRKGMVISFLRAIAGVTNGITATQLAEAVKLQDKRAIGAYAKVANRIIAECGFKTESVYLWKKKAGKEKTWFPKPQIEEAIKAVEGL